MKKTMTAIVVLVIAIATAACSGSSKSAEAKYNAFYNKYSDTMAEVVDAFGGDSSGGKETFAEYVADYDCEPLDASASAIILALIGPSLTEHGHDPVQFMNDFRALDAAIRAEGHCSGKTAPASNDEPAPTTTTTEPYVAPTTTTTEPNLYGSAAADLCYGEAWDGLKDLSDSLTGIGKLSYETGVALTASQRATVNEGLKTMQDTVDTCKGVVSADFTSNSQDLVNATKELVNLYLS